MKYARISYQKEYPPFGEGYLVEIFIDGDFHFESFFALQHCVIDDTQTDPKNFIHFSLLKKIAHLMDLGYQISMNV